jgi:hypothetical protein
VIAARRYHQKLIDSAASLFTFTALHQHQIRSAHVSFPHHHVPPTAAQQPTLTNDVSFPRASPFPIPILFFTRSASLVHSRLDAFGYLPMSPPSPPVHLLFFSCGHRTYVHTTTVALLDDIGSLVAPRPGQFCCCYDSRPPICAGSRKQTFPTAAAVARSLTRDVRSGVLLSPPYARDGVIGFIFRVCALLSHLLR